LKKIKSYPFYNTSNPLLSDPNQLDIFKGKTFLEFNDIIGLPVKNSIEHKIYDYELDVIDKIESNRNIWIKKARGIGITELVLRYLTWKIVSSNELEYKKIMIVSGTMLKHANNVKERMQSLFERKFPLIQLQSKFTELWIKNTNIICMPSRNVRDIRGFTDISYLFIDEGDYFEPSINNELLHAITAYEEKSNCTTIMVSTPNAPGRLFETIEKDPHSKYEKIILDYTVGLDKIYDRKEIEKKKNEPEFPREYMGQYLGKVGNVFLPSQIQTCIDLGSEYSIDKIPVSLYTLKSVAIDPGFSSSSTGIVTLEHIKVDKDIIRVVDCHMIDKGDPNQIVELCWSIWRRFNYMNSIFFVDGSNRAMVNLLKIRWDEPLTWETSQSFGPNTKIRPVNFSTEHRNMLSNLHAIISKGYLAIEKKHDKLLISLRTAYAEELNLKKEQTSYDDLLDALRLALKAYNIE
jgi:hypothetical protein